jgi:hypothetical protein
MAQWDPGLYCKSQLVLHLVLSGEYTMGPVFRKKKKLDGFCPDCMEDTFKACKICFGAPGITWMLQKASK